MAASSNSSPGERVPPSEQPTLPGEDLASTEPRDAEHWAAVYEEFLRFLQEARSDAGRETDLRMARTAQLYERRLRYWRRRQRSP